jgi:hypothetical protein
VDYQISVQNTSTGTNPQDLSCTVTDPLLGVNENLSLVAGAAATEIQASYTVQDTDPDPLVNTASISCTVDGFGNVVEHSDGHSVDLVHPAFTAVKTCTSEPVPQAGPATWNIAVNNTGDVALDIVLNDSVEGLINVSLAAGGSTNIPIELAGPFAGQATVSNTVTGTATIPGSVGTFTNVISSTSSTATCAIASKVKITKLTQGDPNEEPFPNSRTWTFILQDCGTDGCQQEDGILETVTSPPSMVTFDADLVPYQFDDTYRYRLCEALIPAGWTNTWMGDANDDLTVETVIPFIPAVNDDPVLVPPGWSRVFDPLYSPPPAEWTNDERCVNFVADAGETELFEIDNRFPGGEPRTIGYWKNWNSCTGGGQVQTAIDNCGPTSGERLAGGCALLDDVLQPPGIRIGDLTLIADANVFNCDEGTYDAQLILDKRTIDNKERKMASDAAYGLAAQLLAAVANDTAGAGVCAAAGQAIVDAQNLLDALNFVGTGDYCKPKGKNGGVPAQCGDANELAGILDSYNNGTLCAP